MIVYKDKTFCMRKECKKYETCHRNYDKAIAEKMNSPQTFIRNMGISVAEFEMCYVEKRGDN